MSTLPRTTNELVRTLARSTTAEELTEFLRLLSNRRRRLVDVSVFRLGPNETIDLRTLASHIASVETDKKPATITSTKRRTVYTNLDQHHLEGLADAQIIEYEKPGKHVCRGPAAPAVGTMLAAAVVVLEFLAPRKRDDATS